MKQRHVRENGDVERKSVKVAVCTHKNRNLLNYWMDLFKVGVFRKLIIRHWWKSHLFLLLPAQKEKLTANAKGANTFHVLPLASALVEAVDCYILFLNYKLIFICLSEKKVSPATRISVCNIQCALTLNCCNFCCLNIFTVSTCRLCTQVQLVCSNNVTYVP